MAEEGGDGFDEEGSGSGSGSEEDAMDPAQLLDEQKEKLFGYAEYLGA